MKTKLFLLFTILFITMTLNADIITLRNGVIINANIVGKQGDRLYIIDKENIDNQFICLPRSDIATIRGRRGIMTDATFDRKDWMIKGYTLSSFLFLGGETTKIDTNH